MEFCFYKFPTFFIYFLFFSRNSSQISNNYGYRFVINFRIYSGETKNKNKDVDSSKNQLDWIIIKTNSCIRNFVVLSLLVQDLVNVKNYFRVTSNNPIEQTCFSCAFVWRSPTDKNFFLPLCYNMQIFTFPWKICTGFFLMNEIWCWGTWVRT